MMNIYINKRHFGYHSELISYPIKGINYRAHKNMYRIIPTEAVFKYLDSWSEHVQYGWFYRSYDSVPYYPFSDKLIHSHVFPVVNHTPYIIDTDYFFYPFLIGCDTFEMIKNLKMPLQIDQSFGSNLKFRRRLEVTKEILKSRYCRKILPWSEWCKSCITNLIGDHEILKKIELLYPAVHNINSKKKYHNKVRLLYLGGYGASFQRKGGAEVLMAYNSLRKIYKNIELIFIGGIPNEILHRYKKDCNFIYYGFLKKKALFDVYKKSDIFILPTRCDTFAFSILEAMNFSLPIITTRGSCFPASDEIVNDGVTGFLIERKNEKYENTVIGVLDFNNFISKLRLLIENKKTREKMGEAGKEEVASGKFSLKKRNQRLKEIYRESFSS